MIELPPHISDQMLTDVMYNRSSNTNIELTQLVDKINYEYEYWDSVKYKTLPKECPTHNKLWAFVKTSRMMCYVYPWDKYKIMFGLTNRMQKLCHEFDMNFGGTWANDSVIPQENREKFLISSLMEEAIYSSQMEGAATTRKVAKDMLRKKISPKDKSQQMIVNNYQTIQYIVKNKNSNLTHESILHIHRLMTEKTLNNPDDAGRLRDNDDVVVENAITHEVVHTPPSHEVLPQFIEDLCKFFNETDAQIFVHPIIKGIIIHFMLAYMHPFADGNGRTARALFYWYMLKQGYWLIEYLSISRVIAKSKKSYEKAYLYVECDKMDLGYFIMYNLKVLEQSFKQLQDYIKKKQKEKQSANTFLKIGNINERQAQILRIFAENPKEVITIKDLQAKFLVSPTTAKTDIVGLLERGLLSEIAFNKVKRGYIKGEKLDKLINLL